MNERPSDSYPKFTKGEKCLFAHLVFTFSSILLIAVIYLIHLYLVEHNIEEVFITRRSIPTKNDKPELKTVQIGQLFINTTPNTPICNTLLLTPQWSIGPGHCIAIRSDPDLSHLLYTWRIRYKYNSDVTIKRSIVHPHFNRDTFANNIGLLHHASIRHQEYNMFKIFDKILYDRLDDIAIVNWNQGKDDNIETYPVQLMNVENCSNYMTSIIELRNYEFCAKFKNTVNTILGHGSLIVNQKFSHILGFFAWGEKQERSLPLVILNINKFQDWLNVITTL